MSTNSPRLMSAGTAFALFSAATVATFHADANEIAVVARTGTVDPRHGPNWDKRTFTSFELTTQLSMEPSVALVVATLGTDFGVFIIGPASGPRMIANTASVSQFGPQLGVTRKFRRFVSTNGTTASGIAIAALADATMSGAIVGHWYYDGSIHPVAIGGQTTGQPTCPTLAFPSEPAVSIVGSRVIGIHECPSGPSITDGTPTGLRIAARDGTDGQEGPGLGIGVGFLLDPGGSSEARLIPSHGGAAYYYASTTTGLNGIWRIDTSTNLPVAVSILGPPLGPANSPDLSFQSFNQSRIASIDSSTITFQATLQGPGVTIDNRSAIVRHKSGLNILVARAGVDGPLGPRLAGGARFYSFIAATAVRDPEQFPIVATVSADGRDSGVWIDRGLERTLVARTLVDDQFGPQLGPDVTFQQFNQFSMLLGGDVIVHAYVQGPGTSESNHAGIWRVSGAAPPTLLLRAGQLIDVDPDQGVSLRVVREFDATPAFGWGQVTSAQLDAAGFIFSRLLFEGGEQAVVRIRAGDQMAYSGFEQL